MITFPYGTSDFYALRTQQHYYVDRTHHIPLLESLGQALVFLRPRRFGKSLWLSTLENYYDVKKQEEFDRLFGDLAIGQNPTPLHNHCMILYWNFSAVDTIGDIQTIKTALYDLLNESFKKFEIRYAQWLQHPITIYPTNAIASFRSLLTAVSESSIPLSLSLLIDEYDNFANNILMSTNPQSQDRYAALVQGEGLLKTLFKSVKVALSGQGLDRVFMTGVSPLVLNELTSGFNVARNITHYPQFHDLCGFREEEIVPMIHAVAQDAAIPLEQTTSLLDTMRMFYNGYRFVPDHATLLYNPTLVFYFLDHIHLNGTVPDDLLDPNLEMDRDKLTYLSYLPTGNDLITQIVNEETPATIPHFAQRISIQDLLHGPKIQGLIGSLLYYLGVLTLTPHRNEWRKLELTIPNQVTRQLYCDHIRDQVLGDAETILAAFAIKEQFYHTGDLEPLCDFLETYYLRKLSLRDYLWINELTIKTVFLSLLHDTQFYHTKSEPENEEGYCDLVILVQPVHRHSRLQDFLFEFKYLSLDTLHRTGQQLRDMDRPTAAALPPVQTALAKAESAIVRYRRALQAEHQNTLRLRCYAVVGLGREKLVWREIADAG